MRVGERIAAGRIATINRAGSAHILGRSSSSLYAVPSVASPLITYHLQPIVLLFLVIALFTSTPRYISFQIVLPCLPCQNGYAKLVLLIASRRYSLELNILIRK